VSDEKADPLMVNVSGSGSDLIRIELSKADFATLRDMATYAHVKHVKDMEGHYLESWRRLWLRLEDINISDYLISEGIDAD